MVQATLITDKTILQTCPSPVDASIEKAFFIAKDGVLVAQVAISSFGDMITNIFNKEVEQDTEVNQVIKECQGHFIEAYFPDKNRMSQEDFNRLAKTPMLLMMALETVWEAGTQKIQEMGKSALAQQLAVDIGTFVSTDIIKEIAEWAVKLADLPMNEMYRFILESRNGDAV